MAQAALIEDQEGKTEAKGFGEEWWNLQELKIFGNNS
jgi:hypothetical protein